MKYLVLYADLEKVAIAAFKAFKDSSCVQDRHITITKFKVFKSEEEAAEFAAKHDGVVLIPAKLNMKIEQVKDK